LFSLAAGPGWVWRQRRALGAALGKAGLVKAILKLCTKNRLFYCMLKQGQVAATGWCSVSFCRHYKVDPGSAVIGPIWTAEHLRGRGIATLALKQALNALMQRGLRIFYIDTAGDNLASQRVIAKCGFGPPVALYIR
jgi:GNAT superfamily N-acetyltransferase